MTMNTNGNLINSARVTFNDRSIECYMCGVPSPVSKILRDVRRTHTRKSINYILALCADGKRRIYNKGGYELKGDKPKPKRK